MPFKDAVARRNSGDGSYHGDTAAEMRVLAENMTRDHRDEDIFGPVDAFANVPTLLRRRNHDEPWAGFAFGMTREDNHLQHSDECQRLIPCVRYTQQLLGDVNRVCANRVQPYEAFPVAI
mmetsp:Transcript_20457/g.33627  ORF Transcript_20457/g.33627 Transcript_20457/m.33627 type:complete len:120 (+) Transcript_20457:643-1002(+)|eukprot:CAMPEP_0184644708 /NCGR_PEP_ID=MMETSP0308-20130426/1386_1 /TAXON_ID=38269 /ORGANISM="Gloeochaete witrockiana, Strain SAG 46.84" /LENGTH=119 /DNA_ID=CAMNT_0027073393 /DNA_START=500 /DNA_END=859 /DNA_ORIENTATION=-